MTKIAVLTSGGDAPGMNAAIRAVTRTALSRGWDVFGVENGYAGLMNNDLRAFTARDVGGIIQVGGTMLGSARSLEFKTEEGQIQAIANLKSKGVDALVVIGGNGSQTGANALNQRGFPVVGIASTIDNDLYGSEMCIGVDTALNIALEAIDRLKVTASSHHRAFLIEVMGRDCGYLALMAGIAGGAEAIVIPEREIGAEKIVEILHDSAARGKKCGLVVVAEGAKNNAEKLINYFRANEAVIGFDLRTTQLGHVQRGGIPSAFDRLLATRFGAAAVEALAEGVSGVLVGLNKGDYTRVPLATVVKNKKPVDLKLLDLCEQLD